MRTKNGAVDGPEVGLQRTCEILQENTDEVVRINH